MTGTYSAVIIIGAGIAGLTAAQLLTEQGVKVLVLEGRDRIAGRQWTYRDSAVEYADMGAGYIGQHQSAVLALLEKLDIQTYKQRCDLNSVLCLKSGRQTYKSGIPFFWNPLILLDLNNLVKTIDKMSKEVPLSAPWDHPKAAEWDSMSVKDFIDKTTWMRTTAAVAHLAIECPFISDPSDISLLYLLWEVHGAGGMEAITSIKNGLQEIKVKGGTATMSDKLAASLPSGTIRLSTRVASVRQQSEGKQVQLTAEDGTVFKCKKVICTAPLPGIINIDFEPPLPESLRQYAEEEVTGHAYKTFVFYDRQFWREKGLNGELLSESGIISYCIDDTKPDGSHPVIMGFIDSSKAKLYKHKSKEERMKLICEQYAAEFEMKEFLEPVNYIEKNWADEDETKFGRNCCVWTAPAGLLTRVQKLPGDEAYCDVYFAGAEISVTMRGYMDGAIRSSVQAVKKVLDSLDYDTSSFVNQPLVQSAKFVEDVPFVTTPWIEAILPSVPQALALVTVAVPVVLASCLSFC